MFSRYLTLAIAACLTVLTACGDSSRNESSPTPLGSAETEAPAGARQQLMNLVEEFFDRQLELNPVFATIIGDKRYNDRMANTIGPEYLAASLALEKEFLERLGDIDAASLTGQDRISHDIFKRDREEAIEQAKYPSHLVPVSQFFSRPAFFAQLGSGSSIQPFETVQDYDNFLGRIDDFLIWMEQAQSNMRDGSERGIVQPRVLMEKSIPQLDAQVVEDPKESIFYRPIENLPADFSDADKERLTEAYEEAILAKLVPAYRDLRDFIRDEYLPETREAVGLSALPNGKDWYDFLIRSNTTTALSADEIHQIGLDEVARLRAEMLTVKDEVGFDGDLEAFFEHLRTDEQFYYDTEEELLDHYRSLSARVAERVPSLFSRLPKADFEIRPIEEFRAKTAAGASYMPPAPDGSRPGVFYVNTYDLPARPKYNIESVFAHEAAPGHHFQIAIQQELEELPRFRRFGGYTAYIEGWGLYAEFLGPEIGLYEDPYQKYGALSAEMWRAIRLVVDTGMHAKGWTREQALEYLQSNVDIATTDAVAEIERYIAIPGQALAYKIGQLKMMELRRRASKELEDRFDIRAFHAAILEDGALPLDVLEAKIDRWIVEQKS